MVMPPLRVLSVIIALRGTWTSKLLDQLASRPVSGPAARTAPPAVSMRMPEMMRRASASVSAWATMRERTRTSPRSQPRTRMPPLRPASMSIGLAPPIVSSRTSHWTARSRSPWSPHQSLVERPKPRSRDWARRAVPRAIASVAVTAAGDMEAPSVKSHKFQVTSQQSQVTSQQSQVTSQQSRVGSHKSAVNNQQSQPG